MVILITGSTGFIGKNLVEALLKYNLDRILVYNSSSKPEMLEQLCAKCDFVFHLAAVHRPEDESELDRVNHRLLDYMLTLLRANRNKCPVLLTSSIQAIDMSAYGRSKFAAEKALKNHARINRSRAIIYRLTNTFGRYAKPNHHSVVATFCYNIAHDLPIVITEPGRVMNLHYIDDVISSFIAHITQNGKPDSDGYYRLTKDLTYTITLNEMAAKLYQFKADLDRGETPKTADVFSGKLLDTFKSYIRSID